VAANVEALSSRPGITAAFGDEQLSFTGPGAETAERPPHQTALPALPRASLACGIICWRRLASMTLC